MKWEAFVAAYGAGTSLRDLAAVLGIPERKLGAIRVTGAPSKRTGKRFPELFALWHGRQPNDDEWPAPRRTAGTYEWLGPEDALLATLVGHMSPRAIAPVLTERLRSVTADADAARTPHSVQSRINRLGLQTTDVLGGVTISDAGRRVGGRHVVQHSIRTGILRVERRGRLLVIPYAQWDAYLAARKAPPAGYVQLRQVRDKLGLRSDKLQALAARGLVPTAIRCFPRGVGGASSLHGVFYLDGEVAKKLIDDRLAGRPMPWFRQPDPGNLKVTWKLYQQRRHPATCRKCSDIWGAAGAPGTFEDFGRRYSPLALGAKRHLTFRWDPGHTLAELAARAKITLAHVRRAIDAGTLRAEGSVPRVTRSEAARWISRGCPAGGGGTSWITLPAAERDYGLSRSELKGLVAGKQLKVKPGTHGAKLRVSRQQCSDLRKARGYTLDQAAATLGVPPTHATVLLEGLNWRRGDRIALDAIHSARQRMESTEGVTVGQAAEIVGRPAAWVEEQVRNGAIRVSRPVWSDRVYIAAPMLERLRRAATSPQAEPPPSDWLSLNLAANLAGVATGTISRWAAQGKLCPVQTPSGARFDPRQVRTVAREYWATSRYKRPVLPPWLVAEARSGASRAFA